MSLWDHWTQHFCSSSALLTLLAPGNRCSFTYGSASPFESIGFKPWETWRRATCLRTSDVLVCSVIGVTWWKCSCSSDLNLSDKSRLVACLSWSRLVLTRLIWPVFSWLVFSCLVLSHLVASRLICSCLVSTLFNSSCLIWPVFSCLVSSLIILFCLSLFHLFSCLICLVLSYLDSSRLFSSCLISVVSSLLVLSLLVFVHLILFCLSRLVSSLCPCVFTLALTMQQWRLWFSCSYSRLNSRDPSVAARRETQEPR